jgi:hypothetical protein
LFALLAELSPAQNQALSPDTNETLFGPDRNQHLRI